MPLSLIEGEMWRRDGDALLERAKMLVDHGPRCLLLTNIR
jgi:hypothetical protein